MSNKRGREKAKTVTSTKLFGRLKGKKDVLEVSENMVTTALDSCLPPKAPPPISIDGTQDVSVFVSTFNSDSLTKGLDHRALSFWLPLGYDVYCLGVQNVENMAQFGSGILDFLKSNGDVYQEYAHFVSTSNKKLIVTYIYVHISLMKQKNFKRHAMYKIVVPNSNSGAYVVNFSLFDTQIKLANIKLSPGVSAEAARRAELSHVLKEMENDSFGDHVILLGDFGFSIATELDNNDLKNYITTKSIIPEWSNDRFQFLLEEFDEMKSSMVANVALLKPYEELPICFPPTNLRAFKRIAQKEMSETILGQLFHPDFDLASLFNYTVNIPCYPDRILFRTVVEEHKSSFKACKASTCEGLVLNSHVPVFTTFRIASRKAEMSLARPVAPPRVRVEPSKKIESVLPTKPVKIRDSPLTLTSSENRVSENTEGTDSTPNRSNIDSIKRKVFLGNHPQGTPKLDQSEPDVVITPLQPPRVLNKAAGRPTLRDLGELRKQKSTLATPTIANFSQDSGETRRKGKMSLGNVKFGSWDDNPRVGICQGCFNAVLENEKHVSSSDKIFHATCFTCMRCRCYIDSEYFVINDLLYCKKCHRDLFTPTCLSPRCGKRIRGERVDVERGSFHPRCFVCCESGCSTTLSRERKNANYLFLGDELFCTEHGTKKGREKTCFVCNKGIKASEKEQQIMNNGELLCVHSTCFKCSEKGCVVSLEKKALRFCYLLKEDRKLLCVDHGNMKCKTCHECIFNNEVYREIFEDKFHIQCVPDCSNCGKKLSSKEMVVKPGDGAYLCTDCGRFESMKVATGYLDSQDNLDVLRLTLSALEPTNTKKFRAQSVLPKSIEDVEFYEANPPPPPPSTMSFDVRNDSSNFRGDGRMSVFTGFSLPPPPPLSTDQHQVHANSEGEEEEEEEDLSALKTLRERVRRKNKE